MCASIAALSHHNAMKLRLALLLSLSLAAAGCTGSTAIEEEAATSSAMSKAVAGTEFQIPTDVVITPASVPTSVTDEDGMEWIETMFSFAIAMPPRSATFPIAKETTEAPGVMNRLPAKSYKGTNILAAYEFYWAGGGFQAIVRKDEHTLIFQKRGTSEGSEEVEGGCEPWTQIGVIEIGANTQVVIDDSHLEAQGNMVISCAW